MFRRKTACLWWTNTKSTSALKPNWGFWRSSLASRIHPSPSKSVSFAPSPKPTLTVVHQRPPPSLLTQPLEKKKHHPKNDLQEEFDIQTFIFLFHIDKLSHTENHAALSIASALRIYKYMFIYGQQALHSSSDHTDGHHISTPLLLLSLLHRGLHAPRVRFGFVYVYLYRSILFCM